MDFTSPSVQFTYDVSDNLFFKKDDRNYINLLSILELNTLGNVSLLDIYLSVGNVVEPHIHQNASELVYCVSGSAVVSIINPFTKELLHFPIKPRQVANVPQGWWHYEVATSDNTHLMAIFDAPIPGFIPASDMLRLTPASIFAHTYCLNEQMVKETLAPLTNTVVIGPPSDCKTAQTQTGAAQTNQTAGAQQTAVPKAPAYPYPAYPSPTMRGFPYAYGQQPQQAYYYPQPPVIGNGGAVY